METTQVLSEPHRVQQRRTKGWRKPENTVSVARPSRWGNPFRVFSTGGGWSVQVGSIRLMTPRDDRAEAVARAVDLFRSCLDYHWDAYPTVEEIRSELGGKNLMCFCPLDQPCHADVLLEIANREGE